MGEINVLINNRTYKLACNDGEEDHLQELATYLDSQVSEIEGIFGKAGDTRLLVMAGLTVADRLSEALSKIEAMQTVESEMAAKLDAASERLETIAKNFGG